MDPEIAARRALNLTWLSSAAPISGLFLANRTEASPRRARVQRWCRSMTSFPWAPKTVVKISFRRDPDSGEIDHLAPFEVADRAGRHTGTYEDEPQVLAEIGADTSTAYFEAQWVDDRWVFGHRVADENW
jgi:hypothetical protein